MIKLDNTTIGKNLEIAMQQQCGASSNCNACMPSGCSCSKCFDSVANMTDKVKEVYNK